MTDGMDRRLRWPCTAPRAGDTFGVFGSQRTKVSDVGSPPLEGVPAPVRVLFPMEGVPEPRLGVSSSGRHALGDVRISSSGRDSKARLEGCAGAGAGAGAAAAKTLLTRAAEARRASPRAVPRRGRRGMNCGR